MMDLVLFVIDELCVLPDCGDSVDDENAFVSVVEP